MRFFFLSRQFKIILAVALSLIAVAVISTVIGLTMSPGANLIATVTAPFRLAATKLSGAVSDFVTAYQEGEQLMIENAELENTINDLRKQLAEQQQIREENEFYKNYLGIKDAHPDFQFTSATLISRDPDDPFGGFVINKGTLADIAAYDPVITDAGLVGYISEVGLTTAKVITLLHSDLTLGALDNRTSDSGVVSGSIELAAKGQTRLFNLSRSCSIAVGDYVISSGEGIFPKGLLIGSIEAIGNDPYNTSIYADLRPFVDLEKIKSVMVITNFEGQGGLDPNR